MRGNAALRIACASSIVAGCATHPLADAYEWDDKRVLCSMSVDDLWGGASVDRIDEHIHVAALTRAVALFHAHDPGNSISPEQLTALLQSAADHDVPFLTYAELADGGPRAGIALAFDDTFVDDWVGIEALLAHYDAHVTFFVTQFPEWTDGQKAELAELASRGHSIQAHGLHHLNALDYEATHPPAQYASDEITPSIDLLRDAGYDISAFAFPNGASDDALDDAALDVIDRVRVGPGSCPY